MDGRTNGKRVVPATVRSSSNVRRENAYPACSPPRTPPRHPPVRCPRRLRRPPSSSPRPLPQRQRVCHAPLLRPCRAFKCPAYPSRSPRPAWRERSPRSGCTTACSTSSTRSLSPGLSWSTTAACAGRTRPNRPLSFSSSMIFFSVAHEQPLTSEPISYTFSPPSICLHLHPNLPITNLLLLSFTVLWGILRLIHPCHPYSKSLLQFLFSYPF